MLASLALAALMVLPAQAQPLSQGQESLSWSGVASASGVGVVLGPKGGDPVFSLACLRGTSEVLAIAYGVKPQAGEQELTINLGQRRFLFVVKPEAMKSGRMVEARARSTPELMEALKTAPSISGAYGRVRLGRWPAPPAALLETLTTRCQPLV